jgi:predicted RNA-binding protein with EMAP domain
MDTQTTINLIGGALLAVVGWFARQIFQAMRDLEKDLRHLEVNLPTNYVSKTDFSETMRDIKGMFQKIFDKLDDKEDKQNK